MNPQRGQDGVPVLVRSLTKAHGAEPDEDRRRAIVAGLLASVVPYIADLVALRSVPAQLFGVLMSINPVFAAAIGAINEELGAVEWAGMFLIVGADASALRLRRRSGNG